jgi:hypothetical protein
MFLSMIQHGDMVFLSNGCSRRLKYLPTIKIFMLQRRNLNPDVEFFYKS